MSLSPGADCPLTLETCNFYSDPGLLLPRVQARDHLSLRGPQGGVLGCFLFTRNVPFFRLQKPPTCILTCVDKLILKCGALGRGGASCTDPDFATFINYLFAHLHIFIHAKFASLLETVLFSSEKTAG